MKIQTVFPAMVMKITCPNCGSEGKVSGNKPPEKDFQVSCRNCQEKFLVKLETRKFYRREVSIPIKYTLAGSGSPTQVTLHGRIVDLSREGLSIEGPMHEFSPEFHKEGNLYHLFFSLPPRETSIKVRGKVVSIRRAEWSTTFTMGIKFFNLDLFSNREIGFFLMP